MDGQQSGKLILKVVPSEKVERKILQYLSTIAKKTSPESLAAKIRKAPVVLSNNISAAQGVKVAAALEKLGAKATFVPHTSEMLTFEKKPEIEPLRPPKSEKGKEGKRKRFRLATALILFVLALGLLGWRCYPLLVYWTGYEIEISKPQQMARTDFRTYRPWDSQTPSIMNVAPQDMYEAFRYQYRWHPDKRFIMALGNLTDCFGEYCGRPDYQNPYKVGKVVSNGKEVRIPLLKNGQKVAEVNMSLPLTFSQAMSACNEWFQAMEPQKIHPEVQTEKGDWEQRLQDAETDVNMVNPLAILRGLVKLEALWHQAGPNPLVLKATARGYAMLLMVLYPDKMNLTDPLAAQGLAFIALAKHLDPSLSLASEEALLAMSMGYTAHATALLNNSSPTPDDPAENLYRAYMQQDLTALKKLREQNPGVLSSYLLARLFWDMGLSDEAKQLTAQLLEKHPLLYPVIVQYIHVGYLSHAKILTVAYPLDILTRLENAITPSTLNDEKTWLERLKGLSGEGGSGDISLSQFESLIKNWQPLGPKGNKGILVHEDCVKTVFRTLYTDALFLRYHMLMRRWGVVEMAVQYVQSLAAKDGAHPLVMLMQAEVYSELGKRNEADALCTKVINHPHVPSSIASAAFFKVSDDVKKIGLVRSVAQKMDGRPMNLFSMGCVFNRIMSQDLEAQYYAAGLARDPYSYKFYKYLAQVSGDDDILSSAIIKFPFSFELLEEAGDYFAGKDSPEGKGKALECYDQALKLVFTRKELLRKKAVVLRDLKRYEDSVRVLKGLIDTHDKNDLSAAINKSCLARTYLAMGKPQMAVEAVHDAIASYQAGVMMVGALAYEKLGDIALAEEIYIKAIKRYPSVGHVLSGGAAFYWRLDRDEKAAILIAQGRKNTGKFSQWYLDDFFEVFTDAPAERIERAIDSLIESGATDYEVSSLGFRFFRKNRPDIAYSILEKGKAPGPMERLEKTVNLYKVLAEWKGEERALQFLYQSVPPKMRGPLTIVLFKDGFFETVLTILSNPDDYPKLHSEFLWLQRLVAWLALENKPSELEVEMVSHYEESTLVKHVPNFVISGVNGYYKVMGRYLMGMISLEDALAAINSPKQRCEFAYYIGFAERLNARFPEAANWYQVCRETLLQNNGEFHWANDELFWWSHMGTKNRHRLMSDDLRAYHANSHI
jgi:tetratricopeptide (TPR) repeat protein